MPSSNIELTENRRPPPSTVASFTSWNPRSTSENSDIGGRFLDGFDEQQRIELDEFYS